MCSLETQYCQAFLRKMAESHSAQPSIFCFFRPHSLENKFLFAIFVSVVPLCLFVFFFFIVHIHTMDGFNF